MRSCAATGRDQRTGSRRDVGNLKHRRTGRIQVKVQAPGILSFVDKFACCVHVPEIDCPTVRNLSNVV
jgi:hypothetical protein